MNNNTVTISPKFQVVIPKSLRLALNLKAGEKVMMIPHEERIEFIPVKSIRSLRGFLKGMDTKFERDEDRL